MGICDLEGTTGRVRGGRLATRFPAPVELGAILIRMPRRVFPENPAVIIDGEYVLPEGIFKECVEHRWQLTYARRSGLAES